MNWLQEIDVYQQALKSQGFHLTVAIKDRVVHFHLKCKVGATKMASFDRQVPIEEMVQANLPLLRETINLMLAWFFATKNPLKFLLDKGAPSYTMPPFANGGFVDTTKIRPVEHASETVMPLPPRPGIKGQTRD